MRKLRVTNNRDTFVTRWLEPWGEDYGMMPGDEFEGVAADAGDAFYFHVVNEEQDVKVYAEGDVQQISVYHKGAELLCGHNRPEDAG